MVDEPEERSSELASDPKVRAREKGEEFCLHAELAAVFEGPRKFDAQLDASLEMDTARQVQQTIGRLEKAKTLETGPLLPQPVASDAAALLKLAEESGLATGDYHVHRRPGEVMIIRWLKGDDVETFYERMQAHFEAGLTAYRQEERSAHEWKQDPDTLAYLDALDAFELRMADRYLRKIYQQHGVFFLSTTTVDEMDILHLSDYLMGVPSADLVGEHSAPPADDPTDADRAWFFKLFALRGVVEGTERMCFFAFLQKSDDW